MIDIHIKTIPHESQRYPTVGDWTQDQILVSDLGNWRYESLVAIHELIEATLCKHLGVSQSEVDTFDMAYEARRVEGDVTEPGDDTSAPYYRQHQVATLIEKFLCAEMNLDWKEYDSAVTNL